MVWYGMLWYGMVWYGMVWYGTIPFLSTVTSVWYCTYLHGLVVMTAVDAVADVVLRLPQARRTRHETNGQQRHQEEKCSGILLTCPDDDVLAAWL